MATPDDIAAMARGYITAALWADCMPLEGDESGGLEGLQVRPIDREYVEALCAAFALAAGDVLDTFAALRVLHGFDRWECVGHDLRLTSGGHGTGFWDRESIIAPAGDVAAFELARDRLTDLAGSRPFSRDGGGDCYQVDDSTAHLDHWPLDPCAPPGERWEPFASSNAEQGAPS